MHVLSVVIVLLLMLAVQGQPEDESFRDRINAIVPRIHSHETSSSSSSSAGNATPDNPRSGDPVNVGDPPVTSPASSRSRSFAGGSTSHVTNVAEVIGIILPPREIATPAPSSLPLGSSDEDFGPTLLELSSASPSNSNSDSDLVSDVAVPAVYTFTNSSLQESSSPPNTDDTSQAAAASSRAVTNDDSSDRYSTGTLAPSEERTTAKAVTSTALSLSSTEEQAVDVSAAVASSTLSPSAGTRAAESAPSSDARTASPNEASPSNGDDDAAGVSSSSPALKSPILYAVVVVALVGLAGAVVAFRAKRQRPVSAEWPVSTETCEETPRMSLDAAWTPPVSQVRVIIDDQHFAIL